MLKLNGQTNCLVHSVIIVNSCERKEEHGTRTRLLQNQQVTDWHLIFYMLSTKQNKDFIWKDKNSMCILYLCIRSFVCFECYQCPVDLFCRAIFDFARDQAPHLVYLTSWVGHSVSVSVSLSNTPSEVSLAYKLRSSWVTPQTNQPTPQDELRHQRNAWRQVIFMWNFCGYRQGTRFAMVKVVMVTKW